MRREWVPPDDWIAGLIRRLRGLPLGADVAGWIPAMRRALAAEVARRRRAKESGEDVQPPRRRVGRMSADDVVRDMLAGPEGRFWIEMLLAMPAVLEGVQCAFAGLAWERAGLRPSVRHLSAPVHRYLVGKVGGVPPHEFWGRGEQPTASQRAAVNAVTPRAARVWLERLSGSDADRVAVLAEMSEIGRAATLAVAPLRLWIPEPGLPRGLWPDPPPEDDDAPVSAGVAAGERPSFVAGRRA